MATSTDLRAAIEEVQNQLADGQLEDRIPASGTDWTTRVARRAGALPWWVVSAVTHAILFLLATLLTVAVPPAQMDEVLISTDVAKEQERPYDEKKPRDVFRNQNEVEHERQVEKPMVYHEEAPIEDEFQTDNDMDSNTSRGREDAISDIPLGGTGVTGSMGVGGGGMAGCFGYRDGGGRRRAVARFGGSKATESAVEAALRWLKRHQEADGRWDCLKYSANERGRARGGDVGVTSLALLAFLGAGHTSRAGRFSGNVRRAQLWLVAQQDKQTGEVGPKDRADIGRAYNHAMASLALAEAYGMTRDPELRGPAQKAVDCVAAWQNPYSGWRYRPRDGDADPSVTGWMLMAVKSAKISGLRVDSTAFQGGVKLLDSATVKGGAKAGRTLYRHRGGSNGRWQSMTGVSLFCRLLMGYRRTDALLVRQADHLVGEPPDWKTMAGGDQGHSMYYWYYGTLATFQMGGEHWNRWNARMKTALVPNQRRGGPLDGSVRDVDGSWDPISYWGLRGGRVYSTAVNALTLEVYYRYLPLYSK
jgi:hypothetical protein